MATVQTPLDRFITPPVKLPFTPGYHYSREEMDELRGVIREYTNSDRIRGKAFKILVGHKFDWLTQYTAICRPVEDTVRPYYVVIEGLNRIRCTCEGMGKYGLCCHGVAAAAYHHIETPEYVPLPFIQAPPGVQADLRHIEKDRQARRLARKMLKAQEAV